MVLILAMLHEVLFRSTISYVILIWTVNPIRGKYSSLFFAHSLKHKLKANHMVFRVYIYMYIGLLIH